MEEKDYFEIVLNGFVSNRKYLTDYFIREYKEAEIKNYGFAEFFNKCLNVVSAIDKELKKQYYSDKKEIQEGLQAAISTNDKEDEKAISEQLNELNNLKECNYSVNLYQFTKGKFTGDLDCEDIKYIALSIGLAIQDLQPESKPEPPETASKDEKPEKKPEYTKLIEAFETTSKYHKIMNLLADKEYCEHNTFIWNKDKGILIFLLKFLHKRKYYKDNRKLKNSEIVNIALNTFGISLSVSYVKQYKEEDSPIKKLIPIEYTLF